MKTKISMPIATAFAGWLLAVNPAFAQTWTSVMTPLSYMPWNHWISVASSADGTKLAVAATNGPICISTNSGADWTLTGVPALNWSSVAESADGSILAAVALNGPIYISTDSGTTWTQGNVPSNNWKSVALSADGTRMLAAATNGPIYSSTDSGATWTPATPTNLWSGLVWSAVASSADGSKLYVICNPGESFIFSTNSGATWVTSFQDVGPTTSIACSADGSELAIAYYIWVLTSTNGVPPPGLFDNGWNWEVVETNYFPQYRNAPGLTAIASSADGSKLVTAAAIGLIYTSTNWGATWNAADAPSLNWSSVASSADGSKLVAVSLDGGIFIYGTTIMPTLGLAQSGGRNVLWWPWPSTGFVLQQNSDLSTTNWTDVTNAPVLVYQVIVSPTGGNNFYRLKAQ